MAFRSHTLLLLDDCLYARRATIPHRGIRRGLPHRRLQGVLRAGPDFVQVPPRPAFFEQVNHYRTCLHGLTHATGHASRVGRDLTNSYGSKDYARRTGRRDGISLCTSLGIRPTVRHADYLASWLAVLREDRRRKRRRRAVGVRAPAPVLALANQCWSLDFVQDRLVTGRQFRVLNIVDDVTRAPPSAPLRAMVDTSVSGRRVVRELADLIVERGKPKMIVSDDGTELTSNAVLAWSGDAGVEWHYIAPWRGGSS